MAAVGRTNPFLPYYFFCVPISIAYIFIPPRSNLHIPSFPFLVTHLLILYRHILYHGLEITLNFIDFRYQYQVFFVFTCCMIYLIIKTLTMFSINSYSRFSIAQKESVLKIQNVSIYFPAASTLIVCKDSCEFLN